MKSSAILTNNEPLLNSNFLKLPHRFDALKNLKNPILVKAIKKAEIRAGWYN